jgi:hypothetical protein
MQARISELAVTWQLNFFFDKPHTSFERGISGPDTDKKIVCEKLKYLRLYYLDSEQNKILQIKGKKLHFYEFHGQNLKKFYFLL